MPLAPLVLFYGEDSNDTHALINLSRALLPKGVEFDAMPVRRPSILRRDANPGKRRRMAEEIAGLAISFASRRTQVTVVAHRDCDETDEDHENHANELEEDLQKCGVPNAIAATPAWEIETWWMLFPNELSKTRPCWAKVSYRNRDVGQIANSKDTLRRDLRPKERGNKCPDFVESDGIKLSRLILQDRAADQVNSLRSKSLQRFRLKLREYFNVVEDDESG